MDHDQWIVLKNDISDIKVSVGEIKTDLKYLPTKSEISEKFEKHRREFHKVSKLNSPFIFKLLTLLFAAALAAVGINIGIDS